MEKSFRNNRKVINVLKLYEQILSVTVPKNASFVPYTSLFCPSWPVYPGLPGLPASCQDLTDRVTQVLSPALCISLCSYVGYQTRVAKELDCALPPPPSPINLPPAPFLPHICPLALMPTQPPSPSASSACASSALSPPQPS